MNKWRKNDSEGRGTDAEADGAATDVTNSEGTGPGGRATS